MAPIQDDIETSDYAILRERLNKPQRLSATSEEWEALERLVAAEAERDRLIEGIGALVERIVNTADPDLSEYDGGKMYVVQELAALVTEEQGKDK